MLGRAVVLAQGEARQEGVVVAAEAAVSDTGRDQVFLSVKTEEGTARIELTPPGCERGRWLAPVQKLFDPKRELDLGWGDSADAAALKFGVRARPSSLAG